MTLDAPAPRLLGARLAEDCEAVQLDIAHEGDHAHLFFQRAENVLMLDDLTRLLVRAGSQAALQQGESQLALVGVHVAQGQAVAVDGRVVPVHPLAVHILEGGPGLLFRGEAVEETAGGCAHLGGGLRLRLNRCHAGNLLGRCGIRILRWSLWPGQLRVNRGGACRLPAIRLADDGVPPPVAGPWPRPRCGRRVRRDEHRVRRFGRHAPP